MKTWVLILSFPTQKLCNLAKPLQVLITYLKNKPKEKKPLGRKPEDMASLSLKLYDL